MDDHCRVDPRQRSADRRRFQRICFAFLIGLVFILISATLVVFDIDEGSGRRSYPNELGFVFGAGWIAAGLFELVRRFVTGPTRPRKRARY